MRIEVEHKAAFTFMWALRVKQYEDLTPSRPEKVGAALRAAVQGAKGRKNPSVSLISLSPPWSCLEVLNRTKYHGVCNVNAAFIRVGLSYL